MWYWILVLSMNLELGSGRDPISIYWNTSNPIFSTGPPTIEVNRDTGPWQFDQINLICPTGPLVKEQHIIYSVSQEEFESCEVWSTSPKIVAVCDKPNHFLYFTITFRYFSPSPRQLEFKPGETYFFISTSAPGDLKARDGGYCTSNNMKMQFRIAESPEVETPVDKVNLQQVPTAFWSTYWRSRVPDNRDIYTHRDLEHLTDNILPYRSSSLKNCQSLMAAALSLLLSLLLV